MKTSTLTPDLLRKLKIRVGNVVNLMKLQPPREHPHGLSDTEFDAIFTRDKPLIFAFHGYPWLIHRLTYRRTNHDNIHVCGYKEEDTIATPFDMTVLNHLDRFHLGVDTIDRLPQTGDQGTCLKQQHKDKLIEHKQYIRLHGQDMPEIRDGDGRNQPHDHCAPTEAVARKPGLDRIDIDALHGIERVGGAARGVAWCGTLFRLDQAARCAADRRAVCLRAIC